MMYRILGVLAALLVIGVARAGDDSAEPTGHPRGQASLGVSDAPQGHGLQGVEVSASSEIATYADSDHVYVFTPSIAGTIANVLTGWRVSGRYLVDVVSAASADVVSTASPPFVEVRHAGTLDAAYKPHETGVDANAAISVEPDYTSVVGGGTFTQDLFAKNVTLLGGYSHLHDIAGRSGTPFSVFSHTLDRDAIKVGLTVLVNRATVLSFVGDAMFEYGDPSKPYRYVPLFAPGTIVPIGASIPLVNQLRLSERTLEQLPLSRDRFALTMRWAHRLRRSTLRLEERVYADTWGLKATTTDARWFFDVGRRVELAPHLRFYAQTPVDFWQRAYILQPDFTYPAIRTGNRELGPLVNLTGGASLRAAVGSRLTPESWVLILDFNVTSTQYLDDIYLTQRLAGVGGVSVEAAF